MTLNNLTRDYLKNLLIEHLKKQPATQVNSIHLYIESQIGRNLKEQESRLLLEMINEFIISNILMPAFDKRNTGWPFLSLTFHGKEVLKEGGPPVYDYDGYLADLKARVPNLDCIVERYLGESLRAYQFNLYYASMVMLGCGSERAIQLLMDTYLNSISKEANRDKLRKRISNRDISTAYQLFKQSFDSTHRQVKLEDAVNDFDAHVEGVFAFIRLVRNSIAHPATTPNVTNALVYSNLQQYSYYIETIFKLIEYYKSNETTV